MQARHGVYIPWSEEVDGIRKMAIFVGRGFWRNMLIWLGLAKWDHEGHKDSHNNLRQRGGDFGGMVRPLGAGERLYCSYVHFVPNVAAQFQADFLAAGKNLRQ